MEEQIRQRMKERGLDDAAIEERIKQMREGGGPRFGGRGPEGAPGGPPGSPDGELPPQLLEFIRNADAQQLEFIKQRMRERGMTEEEIETILTDIRGTKDVTRR